jgi:hypothetical protein
MGAAYVFHAADHHTFHLQQKFIGSDTRLRDGFGQSIAIVNDVIVVGAVQETAFTTPLTIRKAIQSITTRSRSRLGATFRIGYRKERHGLEETFVYVRSLDWRSCDRKTNLHLTGLISNHRPTEIDTFVPSREREKKLNDG